MPTGRPPAPPRDMCLRARWQSHVCRRPGRRRSCCLEPSQGRRGAAQRPSCTQRRLCRPRPRPPRVPTVPPLRTAGQGAGLQSLRGSLVVSTGGGRLRVRARARGPNSGAAQAPPQRGPAPRAAPMGDSHTRPLGPIGPPGGKGRRRGGWLCAAAQLRAAQRGAWAAHGQRRSSQLCGGMSARGRGRGQWRLRLA